MKNIESSSAANAWQDTVLNNKAMDSVRKMGRDGDPEALRSVANQFESMFIQQMFKSMRAATDVFSEGSYLNSSETEFYQDMLDQQYSLNLSKGKGMGLASALYDQMMRSYGGQMERAADESASNMTPKHAEGLYIGLRATSAKASEAESKVSQTPVEFVNEIRPYAQWAASKLGVSTDAIIAQAALETGWGKFVLQDAKGNSSFNMFNIKAGKSWNGDAVSTKVTEYVNGAPTKENATFKKYQSLQESFSDYVDFMRQPRYKKALEATHDSALFSKELQSAGFATDPHYSSKIQTIIAGSYLKNLSHNAIIENQGEG